jgi:hypothetical protein
MATVPGRFKAADASLLDFEIECIMVPHHKRSTTNLGVR